MILDTCIRPGVCDYINMNTVCRSVDEVKHWDTVDTPINRIRNYLTGRAWWDETQEKEFRSNARGEILRGFKEAENTKLPNPLLVSSVYSFSRTFIL